MLNESFDSLGERSHSRQWRKPGIETSFDTMLSSHASVNYWPGDPEWSELAYWFGDLPEWSEVSSIPPDEHAVPMTTFLWRWAKEIASNVFVGTFLCQIIFLFLLWDLRSRRRQKWTTRRTAGKDRGKTNSWARIFPRGLLAASRVEVISGLFLLHMAVFSISSLTVELQTRFTGDVVCGVALMLLFSIYCILEPYAQHI